ncbi:MAG: WD40 repeat domain-containing protein, partial [Verrucomicrobiota bacterium]
GESPKEFERTSADTTLQGGAQARSCAFSPEGNLLAVGYDDLAQVDVFEVRPDGRARFSFSPPPTLANSEGALGRVCWSDSGDRLYTSGYGNPEIFYWDDGGQGEMKLLTNQLSLILDMIPLKNGGLIFSGGLPLWNVVNDQGETLSAPRTEEPLLFLAETPDFRSEGSQNLWLSEDGSTVSMPLDTRVPRVTFDALRLRYREDETEGDRPETLFPPLQESTTIAVENWDRSFAPTLEGSPLPLRDRDFSRSLAIAPQENRFVLGTESYLLCFDSQGELLWERETPVCMETNISRDGRFVVVACGDGTLRWFRLSDGEPLLAFFAQYDRLPRQFASTYFLRHDEAVDPMP